jgi:hypothetical protein
MHRGIVTANNVPALENQLLLPTATFVAKARVKRLVNLMMAVIE